MYKNSFSNIKILLTILLINFFDLILFVFVLSIYLIFVANLLFNYVSYFNYKNINDIIIFIYLIKYL